MTSDVTRGSARTGPTAEELGGTPPPAAVVAFLQRVFDFADTLDPREGRALRRLVRAGLLADDGTIDAILSDDVAGYQAAAPLLSGIARPAWYWE